MFLTFIIKKLLFQKNKQSKVLKSCLSLRDRVAGSAFENKPIENQGIKSEFLSLSSEISDPWFAVTKYLTL
jgi:hypothetical protein